MPIDRADQSEGDDSHDQQRAHPAGEHPGECQVNPNETGRKAQPGILEEAALLLGKTGLLELHSKALTDVGQDDLRQLICDLLGAGRIIFRNFTRHRDHTQAIFAPDGREPGFPADPDEIRERHVIAGRCAQLRTLKEIGCQLFFGQSHPDVRGARPDGEGGGLNASQPVPQDTAQPIDGKAQRGTLRCQVKHKLVLVKGHAVFNRRDFPIARQRGLQLLRSGLEPCRACAEELHIEIGAPRAPPPTAEGKRFHQRMAFHGLLQIPNEFRRRIGAQVRVDQFDSDTAQKIGVFGVGASQRPPCVATHLSQRVGNRVDPVFRLILHAQRLNSGLQRAHLLNRITALSPGRHGEVARHAALFRRRKEAPLHIPAQEHRDLGGEQHDHGRQHRVSRPDHQGHEPAEDHPAEPVEPAVHIVAWVVKPCQLALRSRKR